MFQNNKIIWHFFKLHTHREMYLQNEKKVTKHTSTNKIFNLKI